MLKKDRKKDDKILHLEELSLSAEFVWDLWKEQKTWPCWLFYTNSMFMHIHALSVK